MRDRHLFGPTLSLGNESTPWCLDFAAFTRVGVDASAIRTP